MFRRPTAAVAFFLAFLWGVRAVVLSAQEAASSVHSEGAPARDGFAGARRIEAVPRLVFRRALAPDGADEIDLRRGRSVPAALAIWNGAAGDHGDRKSITSWHELAVQE